MAAAASPPPASPPARSPRPSPPATLTAFVRRGHPRASAGGGAPVALVAATDAVGGGLSYPALWARIAAAAAGLAAAPGVRHGGVVGVAGPAGVDAPILLHAVAALGAALCPIFADAPPAEMVRLLGPLRPCLVAGAVGAVNALREVAATLSVADGGRPVGVLVLDGDVPAPWASVGGGGEAGAPTSARGVPLREFSFATLVASAAPGVDVEAVLAAPGVSPDDLLLLPHSSGTTGPPKVVALSHRAFTANIIALSERDVIPFGSVAAAPFPMYHIGGVLVYAAMVPYMRATGVVVAGPAVGPLLAAVATHRVSTLILFPPLMHALAAEPAVAATDTSSLAAIWVGGGPTSAALEAAVATRVGVPVGQVYGSSEGLLVCTSDNTAMNAYPPGGRPAHGGGSRSAGSVGTPLDSAQVRVVRVGGGGGEDDVPPGAAGELLIRSPFHMAGYLGAPAAATAAAIDKDGWHHTGDLGRVDPATGVVWVLDRLTDTIAVGAQTVSPVEVEAALCAAPGIAAAAVVGAPHPVLGQVPHAFVVAPWSAAGGDGCGGGGGEAGAGSDSERGPPVLHPPPLTVEAVLAWAATQLAPHKVPRGVTFVEALPTSGSGKILRQQLRKQLGAGVVGGQ